MFFGIIILNSQLYIVNTGILAQTFNIHVLSIRHLNKEKSRTTRKQHSKFIHQYHDNMVYQLQNCRDIQNNK
jgi:hypothetical protein